MVFETLVTQPTKMLKNLSALIDKAAANAEAKKYDVSNVLQARLAPDQFNFIRQVQITCDTVKAAAARLAGQEPPKHEDNEKTVPELKARIQKTLDFLASMKAENYKDYEKRMVPIGHKPGKAVVGKEFLEQMVIPNFYFHLTTAYAILRHNGVEIGKSDYLGHINLRDM